MRLLVYGTVVVDQTGIRLKQVSREALTLLTARGKGALERGERGSERESERQGMREREGCREREREEGWRRERERERERDREGGR